MMQRDQPGRQPLRQAINDDDESAARHRRLDRTQPTLFAQQRGGGHQRTGVQDHPLSGVVGLPGQRSPDERHKRPDGEQREAHQREP
jgi:hypothetical protein